MAARESRHVFAERSPFMAARESCHVLLKGHLLQSRHVFAERSFVAARESRHVDQFRKPKPS